MLSLGVNFLAMSNIYTFARNPKSFLSNVVGWFSYYFYFYGRHSVDMSVASAA
jgi:hypothetical protein